MHLIHALILFSKKAPLEATVTCFIYHGSIQGSIFGSYFQAWVHSWTGGGGGDMLPCLDFSPQNKCNKCCDKCNSN